MGQKYRLTDEQILWAQQQLAIHASTSPAQIAKTLRVSRETVSKINRGERIPRKFSQRRIVRATNQNTISGGNMAASATP